MYIISNFVNHATVSERVLLITDFFLVTETFFYYKTPRKEYNESRKSTPQSHIKVRFHFNIILLFSPRTPKWSHSCRIFG